MWFIFFIVFTITQATANVTDEAQETFNLLNAGDTNINFKDSKDLIVVLGTTGTGKSTLVQFLAGDNDKLIVKKKEEL